ADRLSRPDGNKRVVHASPSGEVLTQNGPPTATNCLPSQPTLLTLAIATRSVQISRSVDVRMSLPAETNLPAPKPNAPVGAPMRRVVQAMPGVVVSAITVKLPDEVLVPAAVTTWIGPLVAPAGTVMSIVNADAAITVALTPLMRTVLPAVSATNPRPSIRTCS